MAELMGSDKIDEHAEKYAIYRIDLEWKSDFIFNKLHQLLRFNSKVSAQSMRLCIDTTEYWTARGSWEYLNENI